MEVPHDFWAQARMQQLLLAYIPVSLNCRRVGTRGDGWACLQLPGWTVRQSDKLGSCLLVDLITPEH